jgi:hypothetical protein
MQSQNRFSKINWYPGSAAADQTWIDALIEENKKLPWIFTDSIINDNSWNWINRIMRNLRIHNINTFDFDNLPRALNQAAVNTLIISLHPGLHSMQEILQSNILEIFKPKKIVFRDHEPGHGDKDILLSQNIYETIPTPNVLNVSNQLVITCFQRM